MYLAIFGQQLILQQKDKGLHLQKTLSILNAAKESLQLYLKKNSFVVRRYTNYMYIYVFVYNTIYIYMFQCHGLTPAKN